MTSKEVTDGILKALLKHMSRADAKMLLEDLATVLGNKSFKDVIKALLQSLEES